MDLTPENKAIIDAKNYEGLLFQWRFAKIGDPWFQGETGVYFGERMKELRARGADTVGASKRIGWEPPSGLSNSHEEREL